MSDITPRATQPTTEFEVGKFYHCQGHRLEYAGPTESKFFVAVKYGNGNFGIADVRNMSPWVEKTDPKPKSFNERAEVLADEIGCRLAAAVAGSAEPVAWRVRTPGNDYWIFHATEPTLCVGFEVEPLYLAPPSPPPPNPVDQPVAWMYENHSRGDGSHDHLFTSINPGNPSWAKNVQPLYTSPQSNPVERETVVAAYAFTIDLENFKERPHHYGRMLGPEAIQEPGLTPLYTIPPTVNAAFDEAAERKLFEAWWSGGFARYEDGEYREAPTKYTWRAWLSSAKVQRGAVAAAVSEPSDELEDARTRIAELEGTVKGLDAFIEVLKNPDQEPLAYLVKMGGDPRFDLLTQNKGLAETAWAPAPQFRKLIRLYAGHQVGVVAEVRKELGGIADEYNMGRGYMDIASKLRSLAAKLGGSNE